MGEYQTPYGRIFYDDDFCQDNYPNIVLYHQPPAGSKTVKLQAAAIRAFKNAEDRIQSRRIRNLNSPREDPKFRPIELTGSWRSCAYQAELYASDPNRYAPPNRTGHTRGLAIDVSQAQSARRLRKIRRALEAEGWHYARTDEPWHASFYLSL